jgi:hypothetical protein
LQAGVRAGGLAPQVCSHLWEGALRVGEMQATPLNCLDALKALPLCSTARSLACPLCPGRVKVACAIGLRAAESLSRRMQTPITISPFISKRWGPFAYTSLRCGLIGAVHLTSTPTGVVEGSRNRFNDLTWVGALTGVLKKKSLSPRERAQPQFQLPGQTLGQ